MAENSGTIDSLLVSLGLVIDAKSFQKGASAIKSITDGMLQLADVAGVDMGFKALTAGVASSYNELKRLSDITGFTVKQIRGLEFAMRRIGSANPVASGQRLAQLIPDIVRRHELGQLSGDAYMSSKFLPAELTRISKTQGNEAATEYFLNAYGSMNQYERHYLQSGVGITENDDIARLGKYGGKYFRESMNMSNAMTPEIDPKLAKVAQDFNDQMATLARNFENIAYSLGSKLLPIVNSFLEVINDFIHANPVISEAMIGAAGVIGTGAALGVGKKILGLGIKGGEGAVRSAIVGRAGSAVAGGALLPAALAVTSEPLVDGFLNSIFGKSDYFQNIRTAQGIGDFGSAIIGNGKGRWVNGKWVSPSLQPNPVAMDIPGNSPLYPALNNPNARSYLDTISRAEGTSAYMNSGYHTMSGGGQIADLSDHPRQLKGFQQTDGTWNKTSAVGRYQFTQKSWDEAAAALGLNDFSPQSQDLAALWLIQRAGQLDNVLSGNFMDATNNLGGVWASLPSSPYAQPKRSAAEMEEYYLSDYSYQRNTAPYNPSFSRSEPSQPCSVTQHVELNISGLGLNEQQVQDSVANALMTAGENLERSFNRNGW
ncbi:glycoside hydrolase family 104 protein [Brenneria goodwinii]|uniref:glycoside hydrolase family 24 protein n=1 Tax=Brenneria goodwinii TaxID=1109412 RepID=UPI000EF17FA2|nr:glycoside hydrolase family 104 protein [Brenneria goodwinii]MCG8155196.1 glycoside hydrolase family 104 protein [Brenneria goodwinii]MCG8159440.1 glycoside hydrolase family 104 protein [Brenneria goodwinii]MCG8164391.1 glycoside hydrolase family 104 protein [Brenneria goodwinii]MCG8169043.1 glycoside hydrolase family 104 protein [Brenneria goodwinii]MCG8173299.1 glycoside hydrolase family 104 protein [Brenneria goodwinii]